MQVKLVRALEERKVRPIGSETESEWNARVVAATHRDLEAAVVDGRFRQDLFFRLAVVEIELPSLRGQGNDILLLASHFLERSDPRRKMQAITPEAAQLMLAYDWPGNVRELRNRIERAVALARFDRITAEDLPARIRDYASPKAPEELLPEQLVSLQELEREYVERVLRAVNGHQANAAGILGIDRKTLYRKLQQWRK